MKKPKTKKKSKPNTQPSTSGNSQAITTFADIKNGTFPSATDKHGTNGVLVEVQNVVVLVVRDESDGDWHIQCIDQTGNMLTCEIIPADQHIGKPPLHTPITLVGVPFKDPDHATMIWHSQGSPWELHPIRSWSVFTG